MGAAGISTKNGIDSFALSRMVFSFTASSRGVSAVISS
jgi:hypothetical protein